MIILRSLWTQVKRKQLLLRSNLVFPSPPRGGASDLSAPLRGESCFPLRTTLQAAKSTKSNGGSILLCGLERFAG